jgi:hypothetical protein
MKDSQLIRREDLFFIISILFFFSAPYIIRRPVQILEMPIILTSPFFYCHCDPIHQVMTFRFFIMGRYCAVLNKTKEGELMAGRSPLCVVCSMGLDMGEKVYRHNNIILSYWWTVTWTI